MVACIDFFEMLEICRPKFIVRHSTLIIDAINVKIQLPPYIFFFFLDFFQLQVSTFFTHSNVEKKTLQE
jgi:hypothetical protein